MEQDRMLTEYEKATQTIYDGIMGFGYKALNFVYTHYFMEWVECDEYKNTNNPMKYIEEQIEFNTFVGLEEDLKQFKDENDYFIIVKNSYDNSVVAELF